MGNIFGSNIKYVYEGTISNNGNILGISYSTDRSECINTITNKLLNYYDGEDKKLEYKYITESLDRNNYIVIGENSNHECLAVTVNTYSSIKISLEIDYINGNKTKILSTNILESGIENIYEELYGNINDPEIVAYLDNLDIVSNNNVSKIFSTDIYINVQLLKQ